MSENSKYVDRAGSFRCIVKAPQQGWFGEAGEKATPFIRIACEVIEEGDQKGRMIVYSAWLSDGAFDRTIKNLVEVFGWDGDLVALDNGGFSFAGMECEIVTEAESYKDELRIKAKWLNAVGGVPGSEMAKEKVSSLIARLGGKAKALAKASPAPKVAPPRQSGGSTGSAGSGHPAVDDSDDIPFGPNYL